jgi:hypothetical protein
MVTANPWLKARDLLQQDYDNGHILDSFTPDDVRYWRDEYRAVREDRFKANFNRWKKGVFKPPATPQKKAVNPWYIAKPLAEQMYIDKIITSDMTMETIHQLRDEFKAVEFDKFKTNFTRSKKRIDKDWERAKADSEGYIRDMSLPNHILARVQEDEWHGSKAQTMLRKIIEGPVVGEED